MPSSTTTAVQGGPHPQGSAAAAPTRREEGKPAVDVRDLGRTFDANVVLEDIDLVVRGGEFVALLGASGSGKTTLLRSLAGLDPDASGTAAVARRRTVVFQDHRLMPWKSVWRNVVLGLPGRPSRSLALEALAEVGLVHRADAWPGTLSGGEAQRVALARAIVRNAELWLLDEPFGALDALTRLNAQGLLEDLCRRHAPAVVLVTHDVEEALLLADRILILDKGRFIADLAIDLDRPRLRTAPAFVDLRAEILRVMGVDEPAPGPG